MNINQMPPSPEDQARNVIQYHVKRLTELYDISASWKTSNLLVFHSTTRVGFHPKTLESWRGRILEGLNSNGIKAEEVRFTTHPDGFCSVLVRVDGLADDNSKDNTEDFI